LDLLLAAGANPMLQSGIERMTPLHCAAMSFDARCVRRLLSLVPADTLWLRFTPLEAATFALDEQQVFDPERAAETFRLLVEAGSPLGRSVEYLRNIVASWSTGKGLICDRDEVSKLADWLEALPALLEREALDTPDVLAGKPKAEDATPKKGRTAKGNLKM
jgi:hypothetical protein